VRAVLGDEVAIYRATLFGKSARGGTNLPWHQDGGSFWGLDRDPRLQVWTALDDAPIEIETALPAPPPHVTVHREGAAVAIVWPLARYVTAFAFSAGLFLAYLATSRTP